LPNNVKRSKIHLYNYIASAKNLEEYDELAKNNMRSTRLLYTYIKENASGSKPTLTIKVKDGESNVSGATVTIGTTEKTTDASGETTFTLDYDNYLVEVEKSGYVDYEENIKFRANHKSFTLNIEAEPVTTGTVTITVLDNSDDSPIMDASVELSDDNAGTNVIASGFTDENGETVLVTDPQDLNSTDIPFGSYYLYTAPNGYTEYNEAFTVDGDETATIKLTEAEGGK
jgi:5-hydroxyisourate hydrolase-like protein (transthyretin family)